jgi:hypothetical protein
MAGGCLKALAVLICSIHSAVAVDLQQSLKTGLSPNADYEQFGGVAHGALQSLRSWEESLVNLTLREVRDAQALVPKIASSYVNDVPPGRQGLYFRPVSVTLQCVMIMSITTLVFHTLLSISRNVDELSATFTPSVVTQTLTIAARSAGFAPMMCMLFVGCRMYVLATTEGLGEPQPWVKRCMWTAVGAMFMQFAIVLLLPIFTRRQAEAEEEASYDMTAGVVAKSASSQEHDDTIKPTKEEILADIEGGARDSMMETTGDFNDVHPILGQVEFVKTLCIIPSLLWVLQALSVIVIHVALGGIVYGIAVFPAQTTTLSAAVSCTISLSTVYFFACCFLWTAQSLPSSAFQAKLKHAAMSMSSVVRKAPMLAAFFIASRMRALQLDPPHGHPSFGMQCLFYATTVCLNLEAVVAAFIGGFGRMEKAYYGVYIYRARSRTLHKVRYFFAIISYAAMGPLILGVCSMKDPKTGQAAELSTTLHCVIWFTSIYFVVQFFTDMVLFAEESTGLQLHMTRDTFVSAGISLGLAPSLCILFIACRMRALQITQQTGDPQGWAQDCMYMGVFATCVQSVCCLLMPIFIGSACKTDEDGNPDYDLRPMIGAYAISILKYMALLTLHGSAAGVCMAVYTMTPETAHGGIRLLNSVTAMLRGIAILLVFLLISLLLSSAKVIGMAVKLAIESVDKKLIGVDVTISRCALSVLKGYVYVRDVVVHQPVFEIIYTKDANNKLVRERTRKKCKWETEFIAKTDLILVKINLAALCEHVDMRLRSKISL